MKRKEQSASDNERFTNIKSPFVSAIMNKIADFDQFTDVHQQEELRINIPIGLRRFKKLDELRSRHVFFDLIYSVKRLRFEVEITTKSSIGKFKIEKFDHNEAENMTSYLIYEEMKLSYPDICELIREIVNYFQPFYLDITTLDEENLLPPALYRAGIKKRGPKGDELEEV